MPRAWVNLQCERRSNRPSAYQRTKKMPEFGKNVVCWKREKGKVRAGQWLAIRRGRDSGWRSSAGGVLAVVRMRVRRRAAIRCGRSDGSRSGASGMSTAGRMRARCRRVIRKHAKHLKHSGTRRVKNGPEGEGQCVRQQQTLSHLTCTQKRQKRKKARANKALTWKYMVGDTRFELVTPTVSR